MSSSIKIKQNHLIVGGAIAATAAAIGVLVWFTRYSVETPNIKPDDNQQQIESFMLERGIEENKWYRTEGITLVAGNTTINSTPGTEFSFKVINKDNKYLIKTTARYNKETITIHNLSVESDDLTGHSFIGETTVKDINYRVKNAHCG